MQPVIDERAILHKGVLALADLHLGFEYQMERAGIRLLSETPRKLQRLKALITKTKAERVLILGDLKHEIPFTSGREEVEVREFIDQIKGVAHVEIIKGNHDGNLDFLDVPIYQPYGTVVGDAGYFHGNTWPDQKLLSAKYLVMGHTHPLVLFEDKLGHRSKMPCWVRSRLDPLKCKEKYGVESDAELIIMPAFSEFAGGVPVNSGERLLGPILKIADLDNSDIYLLDGTHLGRMHDLRLNRNLSKRKPPFHEGRDRLRPRQESRG